jgi:putative endonuclease
MLNNTVIPAQAGIQRPGTEARMERQPCVYILANKRNGTLYVGLTSNLIKRVWEHKQKIVAGFTQKYSVDTLVWYELHETMVSAISREKAIKNWKRSWKIKTIEMVNPEWSDLYHELTKSGFRHAPE